MRKDSEISIPEYSQYTLAGVQNLAAVRDADDASAASVQ